MKKPHRTVHMTTVELRMTAMIDIVFQLLIFFVCTASFQTPEELLPTHLLAQGMGQTATAPRDPIEPVTIELSYPLAAPVWVVGGRTLSDFREVEKVLAALASTAPEVPVILKIKPEVPLGVVVDLYDLCRYVGFQKIQFAARLDSLK